MTVPKKRGPRGPYAKSVERRSQILAATEWVFRMRGYRAGTLQEIADRAGMGQSSLLHHFPTKEALLRAVLIERDVRADDLVISGDISSMVVGLARENESNRGPVELYSVLLGEATTQDHPAREYFQERLERVHTLYAQILQGHADAGELRPGVDPSGAASALVALWDGTQQQWLLGAPGVSVPDVLGRYLALLFTDEGMPEGLRPYSGRSLAGQAE
ncbi:TetR/AcrR family transcriptional regulator [Mycetocola tolaasinivorans]|uniref:TetR/AcrR family transcriptional regulator n=1 Tax=Mycetocola tolaasinivorans TaxID=76635 RepID=A0A3L7A933_9MICO|nr:TetR/AcrR family transcriptional regulator [Mycetocola tolaasinivorans]RLP76916.1 TetR/AcrR family transcriptional regulator [Mycetocola tolaasinivorans]